MITLCMICQSVTNVDFKVRCGLSHGLCYDCIPGYLRQSELTEEEIETIMNKYKENEEMEKA